MGTRRWPTDCAYACHQQCQLTVPRAVLSNMLCTLSMADEEQPNCRYQIDKQYKARHKSVSVCCNTCSRSTALCTHESSFCLPVGAALPMTGNRAELNGSQTNTHFYKPSANRMQLPRCTLLHVARCSITWPLQQPQQRGLMACTPPMTHHPHAHQSHGTTDSKSR
jgi:hypothetical protein